MVIFQINVDSYVWVVGTGYYHSYYNEIRAYEMNEYDYVAFTGTSLDFAPGDITMNISVSADKKTVTLKSTYSGTGIRYYNVWATVL